MLTFLIAHVPQLVIPWHVETHMIVRRLETLGVGCALRGEFSSSDVQAAVASLTSASKQSRGWEFASAEHSTEAAVQRVVDAAALSEVHTLY
jgi:UDP:flavonoid glycosyltransferase YjiC (YdhE family)